MLLPVHGGTTGGGASVTVVAAGFTPPPPRDAELPTAGPLGAGAPAGPATPATPATTRGSVHTSTSGWSSVRPLSNPSRTVATHPVLYPIRPLAPGGNDDRSRFSPPPGAGEI